MAKYRISIVPRPEWKTAIWGPYLSIVRVVSVDLYPVIVGELIFDQLKTSKYSPFCGRHVSK